MCSKDAVNTKGCEDENNLYSAMEAWCLGRKQFMLPGWATFVAAGATDLDRATTCRASVYLLWEVEVMTRDLDLLMISEVRSNVIGVLGEWFEYFGENPQYRVILMDYSDDWVEIGISVIGELETRR